MFSPDTILDLVMLDHTDVELTATLMKACFKRGYCVNQGMLEYAIMMPHLRDSMFIIRHYGLLPQPLPAMETTLPDLWTIYQRYIIKDKKFKEKFNTTHMLLTENKPLLFSSYTNCLLGKKWFSKQDNISLIIFMKLLMCAKVVEAHQTLTPLFDGGKYATCKQERVDADSPCDSIYLFDDGKDSDKPTRVCRFSQLSIADNQGILNAKIFAHRCS